VDLHSKNDLSNTQLHESQECNCKMEELIPTWVNGLVSAFYKDTKILTEKPEFIMCAIPNLMEDLRAKIPIWLANNKMELDRVDEDQDKHDAKVLCGNDVMFLKTSLRGLRVILCKKGVVEVVVDVVLASSSIIISISSNSSWGQTTSVASSFSITRGIWGSTKRSTLVRTI